MFKKPADPGSFCPLVKGDCVRDKCKFWVHVQMKDPQNGESMDFPDCAIKWLPALLIKNAQEIHQTAAAIESSRNEAKKNAAGLAGALLASRPERLIESSNTGDDK